MIKLLDLLIEAGNNSSVKIDKQFNLELINRINFNYNKNFTELTPREINDGFCHIWAELFVEKFGGERQWSFDFPNEVDGHNWVKLNNKYYDAEASNGVANLEELPFFKRIIAKRGTEWLNADFFDGISSE